MATPFCPALSECTTTFSFPKAATPPIYSNMAITFPRLYLALGVTTIRTTGSVTPYTDLEIKKRIDGGSDDRAEDARYCPVS